MNIDDTLAERGTRYGVFTGHARITQDIKRAMMQGNWAKLADDQREALEMVAHKVGRILNGDPDYHDSWHDIVGYVKLVADRLLCAPAPATALAPVLADMDGDIPDPPSRIVSALEGHGLDDMSDMPDFISWLAKACVWCRMRGITTKEEFTRRGWTFEQEWLEFIK